MIIENTNEQICPIGPSSVNFKFVFLYYLLTKHNGWINYYYHSTVQLTSICEVIPLKQSY